MRSEDQLLANKSTRRSRGLVFDNTDIFYRIIAHAHFREILSGYFLFSRFDWSIFVTQLVAKHMKEIINTKLLF
jgi:hypothetical protein